MIKNQVTVIILVLILLVWAYFSIENYDPERSPSLFYRRLSHPRRGHDANGKTRISNTW